jgi:hypothetical protein
MEWAGQAGALYERVHQQYVGGARKLEALIDELIGEEEGINYLSATARAKDPDRSWRRRPNRIPTTRPGRSTTTR